MASVFGFSRLLVRYALVTRDGNAAKTASHLTPLDAQAHVAAATLSNLFGSPSESLAALEKAVALRPSDYSLWLAVGIAREQQGDPDRALAAFDRAVERAPFYAPPRWQRGNFLLRTGRFEAAFADLRQAGESNPELMPKLLDLAWNVSGANTDQTRELAGINTPIKRLAFARFLVRVGKAREALAEVEAAGASEEGGHDALILQLLERGAYQEAHTIWKKTSASGGGSSAIDDGGFEDTMVFSNAGFGWRVPPDLKGVRVSLDTATAHSGRKSLAVDFQGESNPSTPFLSQLIVVEPAVRYKLNFAASAKDIVSGGPPHVVVSDAGERKRLAASATLNKETGAWQVFSVEFATGANTRAVVVSVERDSCNTSPCPAFGSLSLDSFSLEPLK